MSGPVAIANNVERPLSFSDPKKSLDSLTSNEQNRFNELNVDVSHDPSESGAINISLPNGESYSGSLLGSVPQGFGSYVWSNGCKYEGEWICGMRHGHGKLQWPSGAFYEGEFSAGYMHGTGTYTRGDILVYKGPWRLNLKHGLGYQTFLNGDVFEGSWFKGTPEGPGKYTWANGNMYFGNMKSGKMSGQGILTWINGDLIEGNWLNGMMHGFGVYTWIDGGCYVGTWTRGVKDGKGTFYPKGSRVPAGQKLYLNALRKQGLLADLRKQNLVPDIHNAINLDNGDVKTGRIKSFSRMLSSKLPMGNLLNLDQSSKTNISPEKNATSSGKDAVFEWGDKEDDMSAPILEREYMQGVLISELVLSNRSSLSSRKANKRQRRLARDIKKPGEQIIKGHRSYDLMLCLQLGIRFTVGKINHIQRREVTETDYGPRASLWINFPKEGSPVTPPHSSEDFKWKDYSPMVFRNLREMFKIDTVDYMMSICGSDALRELSSPGKSGSVFFLSQDGRFMIKTLRKSELKVLLRMLPNYHHHVQTYENTLITKCFGLHMIKPTGGQKFRFVVMGSIFCTELRIHKRFDLKGSSLGRSADKIEIEESTVLKDLDLNDCFYLEPSWRADLLRQIEIDSKFLESENIMDYSLLLGVHYRAPQHLRSLMSYRHCPPLDGLEIVVENESMEDEVSPQGLVLVPRAADDGSVVIGPHVRGGPLKASGSTGDEEVDLLLPGAARLQIQLGVNLPARAEHIPGNDDIQIFHGVYDVVLYMGIIDILQEYNMSKKLEHAYKSTQFDSKSISAVAPTYYSQRFLSFIQKIFPSNSAPAGSNN